MGHIALQMCTCFFKMWVVFMAQRLHDNIHGTNKLVS